MISGDFHEVHRQLNLPQGTYSVSAVRFPGTGGAPPQGVGMLKRRHGMNSQGFAIAKPSQAKPSQAKPSNGTALFLHQAQGTDLIAIATIPAPRTPTLASASPSLSTTGFPSGQTLTSCRNTRKIRA